MASAGIILAVIVCCVLVIVGTVLGVYFSKVACPEFGSKCPSSPSPGPRSPGPAPRSPGPAPRSPGPAPRSPGPAPGPQSPATLTRGVPEVPVTTPTCTGRTQLNTAGNACVACSLPTGKGFASTLSCATIDCSAGQFGSYSTVGCSACSKSDLAVPPGWILQGGSDDCATIRCQTGTSPNATKTTCVADYVPPPPAGCTGYWNDATQCNMPVSCGQRGYHIDTYVVPVGSGACSVAHNTERRTRQCDTWTGANPAYGYTYPCI